MTDKETYHDQHNTSRPNSNTQNLDRRYNPLSRGKSQKKGSIFFGVSTNGRAIRLRILFKDGRIVQLSYSLLLKVIFNPKDELVIDGGDFKLRIFGRGLRIIEDFFSKETLLFIKESPTPVDDQSEAVFVSHISMEGTIQM